MANPKNLLVKPNIINVGLKSMADNANAFTTATHLDWQPSAFGDSQLAMLVAKMSGNAEPGTLAEKINNANKLALERVVGAQPVVVDMKPAIEVLEGMDENTIYHAGPPIEWKNMCGAMRGSITGAMLYEGRATTEQEAVALASSGKIRYAPCHSVNPAGPMAGIISPSMPMWVVENKADGKRAYCTMNEGWGRTLRFGAFDSAVIERLHWMESTLCKAMKVVIEDCDGINLKSIIAQALQMGDECHNRDIAATNIFFKMAAPIIVRSEQLSQDEKVEVIDFLGKHEHFVLNLAMAACKASLISAENIPYSTMVTVMARNGYEVGIRISGMGDRWFTAPATVPDGLYFPGYSPADANPDIGDSAITETGGIGAFAMGTAPAIVQFVGGSTEEAVQYTNDMFSITIGRNNTYKMPNMSFAGTPTGIDILKVLANNILPVINTGIAHKEPGHGLVGAGIVPAPADCFAKAATAFAENHKDEL